MTIYKYNVHKDSRLKKIEILIINNNSINIYIFKCVCISNKYLKINYN